jgi:uncharacterized LabA/DUF88 family protein
LLTAPEAAPTGGFFISMLLKNWVYFYALSSETMEFGKDLRLAVLIDADNVPYSNIQGMLLEIAKYGTPTFKRIYADWTKPTVSGWKTVLLEHAITPVQQYAYTTGKNSTDSALIIDAMDILYTGRVDGFCIVSSDSDFTRLATRLREAGMKVFGIGERKTPPAFISACDKFIYIEILKVTEDAARKKSSPLKKRRDPRRSGKESVAEPIESPVVVNDEKGNLLSLVSSTVADLADENGWVFLGDLGNLLLKKKPDFDPRNFGFKKLLELIESLGKFEINKESSGRGNTSHVYVRLKS